MNDEKSLPKLPTGIKGFDEIARGGIPEGRTTMISGTSGSGKTILGAQFLYSGIKNYDQNGVFLTFEEIPKDIIRNVRSFGWNFQNLLDEDKLAFVDGTLSPDQHVIEAGIFDLSAMMARIEYAIKKVQAKRVVIDSIGAFLPRFVDKHLIRHELYKIHSGLRNLGVTTLITLERIDEDGNAGRYGVEEFVADNVVILRNRNENEKRRRTAEILKFRGTTHQKGEYPFTIDTSDGLTILPVSAMELKQKSSTVRVSSGVSKLDEMCGGGIYRDSITLVSGATGTGKTLLVTEYIKAAIESGEKAILFGAEESRQQLTRNAESWGIDFAKAEEQGLLKIICRYPEMIGLEDHLLLIQRDIEEFNPRRIAIDSMSAYERVSTNKSFREFVIGLTSHLKEKEITGIVTNTTAMLMGGESITETHISSITDTIILLRYVEFHGEVKRGITVLKMRGTWHDKEIHEYTIDGEGMNIKEPFRGIHGILSGDPTYTFVDERERLDEMFDE